MEERFGHVGRALSVRTGHRTTPKAAARARKEKRPAPERAQTRRAEFSAAAGAQASARGGGSGGAARPAVVTNGSLSDHGEKTGAATTGAAAGW